MKNTILRIFDLIKKGELKFVFNGIAKRIYSKMEAFGLKRDLSIPFTAPEAKIKFNIRSFRADDTSHFSMDLQNTGLVAKNIPNCYVAANMDDVPCYRQWLMGPDQNMKIRDFWKGTFPNLNKDEGLLESAFTVPDFRGQRIMPAAMARIAEKGKDLGIRYVITFVGTDNIPSLKGCKRSGFSPYVLRTEKWVLFKRTINFEDVPQAIMDEYLINVGA
jgi:GNAT superfamily N-acetyltransferase